DALAMVRQGVKIGTLNIGGMAWRPGKKQLTKAVSLDDDDINAFHELNNLGVILDLRVVAGCLSNGSPGGKNRYPEYWRHGLASW
ncbi:PTS sugar transporter subunit IIB, partial [Enterobacter hormaechei]|uniref:PTS sugar transporter subunit IIB n=1 Tax=Enterobacter hormaechei TaxID=158836 RepID=UPI001F0A3BA7